MLEFWDMLQDQQMPSAVNKEYSDSRARRQSALQRDFLERQVHDLEKDMDSAFASIEKYLGVTVCLSANKNSAVLSRLNCHLCSLDLQAASPSSCKDSHMHAVDNACTSESFVEAEHIAG